MSNRILIYYFSGTGNAKASAHWIEEVHKQSGDEVEIISISKQKRFIQSQAKDTHLIYLLYPTHGFNAPPIILQFIWSIKRGNCSFILMNTRGGGKIGKRIFTPGLNGIALYLPALMLMIKGHSIKAMHSIDLPSNWISLHPAFGPKAVNSMIEKRESEIRQWVTKPKSNTARLLASLPFDLAVIPIALPYFFLGRFALAKTFYASHNCNACGKCIKQCPVKAIEWKRGRPFWTTSCESCMKCMGNCPNQSIETAHGFTALLWWITLSAFPFIVLSIASQSERYMASPLAELKPFVIWLLIFTISLPLIFLGYQIFHLIMGNATINKLVTYSSLTSYKFWRKYQFPKK
jgi:ferredoxin